MKTQQKHVSSATQFQPELLLNGARAHVGNSNLVIAPLKVWKSVCPANVVQENNRICKAYLRGKCAYKKPGLVEFLFHALVSLLTLSLNFIRKSKWGNVHMCLVHKCYL